MNTKNSAKQLIHTLSINHKASNKQITKDFGKFVRELLRQQRGCEYGIAYENMEILAKCLQDEMNNIVQEFAEINMYFNPAYRNNDSVIKCGDDAITHFWNNVQLKGFTKHVLGKHVLGKNEAIIITNNKMLQKKLGKSI